MGKRPIILLLGLGITITITIFIFILLFPRHQAKEAVDLFYEYEQEGIYAESWDMFHSQMKAKFSKAQYIEERADIFLDHFATDTFSYSLSDVDQLSNWRMSEGAEVISEVYRVTVTQYYNSKYGNFEIEQNVYATKEDGNWAILWNYKE